MFDIFDGLDKLGFTQIPDSDSIFHLKHDHSKKSKKADSDDGEHNISQYVVLRKRVCPVCEKDFAAVVIRNRKLRYLHSDTDLRAYYSPFEPIYYDITLCHFCGYAAMNSHFDRLSEKQSDAILEFIKPQYKYKEYPLLLSASDAMERYLLALLCATVKHARASEKAMLCLRLAWIARDQQDAKRELEYMTVALEGFELAYEHEDFPLYGMESITLCYLLGELNRRIGRKSDAMAYISKVISSSAANNRLKDRARDVRDLMKD